MLFRPTISCLSELKPETHTYIYILGLKSVSGLSACHYAGNVFPGKIVVLTADMEYSKSN